MAAVSAFWGLGDDERERSLGCKHHVDVLEARFAEVRDAVKDARCYIFEHWNEIAGNALLLREVKDFLSDFRRFDQRVEAFDDEWLEHDMVALEIFTDYWIARKYCVMAWKESKLFLPVVEMLQENAVVQNGVARAFRGAAKHFEGYVSGATDAMWQRLIRDKQAFPTKARWIGKRNEAVILAEYFGIPVSVMNESFIWPGTKLPVRPLSITQDAPTKALDTYRIMDLLNTYQNWKR